MKKYIKFFFALAALVALVLLDTHNVDAHLAGVSMATLFVGARTNVVQQAAARLGRLNNLDGAYNNRANIFNGGGGESMNNADGGNGLLTVQNIPQTVADFKSSIGRNNKWFKLIIANAAVTDLNFYLTPGLIFQTAAGAYTIGMMKTGAFKDISNTDGLSGAGSPGTIEQFNFYMNRIASKILGFKVSSTVSTQVEQTFTITPQTIFGTAANYPLNCGNFKDEYSYNANIVTVPAPFQLDYQTQIIIPVVASSTLSLTLYFDEFANPAGALAARG